MTPASPALEDPRDDVTLGSKLLGDLCVPTSQIYTFRNGIYGFPGAHTFALLPTDRDGLFWLQSLDNEALTFLLVDPFHFVEGYSVDLDAGELAGLGPDDPAEILVLATLTLPSGNDQPTTVNLKGPIAMNVVRRLGRQLVVESEYGLRHPIDLGRKPAASDL